MALSLTLQTLNPFSYGNPARMKTHVDLAAKALDARRPGWAARVDPDTLYLASHHACVLAQVFTPRWWWPLDRLRTGYVRGLIAMGWWRGTGEQPVVIGFDPLVFIDQDYAPAWREAIRARLAPASELSSAA